MITKSKIRGIRLAKKKPGDACRESIGAESELVACDAFVDPVFESPDADGLILGPVPPPAKQRKNKPPEGLPAYLNHLWTVPLLSRDEEQFYFRKYNYLKFLINRCEQQRRQTRRLKARANELRSELVQTRNKIIESNLRLVVSLAKRFASTNIGDFDEFVGAGNASLIRAVERFDYRRGFRFSTYAYQAIQRSIFDVYQKDRRQRERFIADGNDAICDSMGDAGEADRQEIREAESKRTAVKLMGELDSRERRIVHAHFGIGRGNEASSLRVIGDELGLSKQRIRQLLQRALAKMHAAAVRHRFATP